MVRVNHNIHIIYAHAGGPDGKLKYLVRDIIIYRNAHTKRDVRREERYCSKMDGAREREKD